ncbi:MAG: triple tyrosine motif-containing protein, partial [Ignavibacteriaceae bacterium]
VDVFSFSIKDGLPDNSIKSIVEDNNGNLWLGTGQGLSFFNTKNNTFTNFTTADGLPGSVFNFESAIKTDNKRILMGTTRGAIFFDPNEITMSAFIPTVVITNFFLFNNPVKAGKDSPLKKSILLADSVILTYSQNVFSFEFAALDYNSPQSIQYAYIMEGFDKEWIYSGSGRLATYTNLDPGEYLFKVKATNADGIWNENAKSVSIIIKPPFWMTWWFRGILIFAFLSLGPIIYYRRVSQLKKEKTVQVEFSKQLIQSQEDERKRIASELHDSLGQDLLVIKNLALLNKNKDDQFEEISKTASLALDEVRRISYNLHPYQLDRLGLSKAISSMFGNIEGASKTKFDLQVDNIDNLLSKDKEINIFRIVQECVNNILKHSGASIATVTVQHIGNQIRIEIADNGKGFDYESAKEQSKGLGLKNLINRVSHLDGEIDYSSTSEFATLIKIQIPVNNEQ